MKPRILLKVTSFTSNRTDIWIVLIISHLIFFDDFNPFLVSLSINLT